MKYLLSKIILLGVLCGTGILFSSFITNPVYLSGRISTLTSGRIENVTYLKVLMKFNGHVVAEDITDSVGHYNLTFDPLSLPQSEHSQGSFDFFITGPGIDTTFLKSFSLFHNDLMIWDIQLPISHKKKPGKPVCPKCNKTDLIFPIVYGDHQVISTTIAHGDTIYSPISRSKYYAGTCVSGLLSPKWYCGKDKIKFE